MKLQTLNAMDLSEFLACLGGVFEHSPWVAQGAMAARPFETLEALHQAMLAAVRAAPRERKLALLRAHPELAGKLALAGELTQSSTTEQAAAGLDRCSAGELERFASLNQAYRAKFDFPFIMAVKGNSRAAILAEFEARLGNDPDSEFETALAQVAHIVWLRLQESIEQ
ncbi:MAG: 2-oxo-4-hydroxy-4-carboxy-5-ureidoimidazoline decarboxylase [Alphaproteobacteria bacterium]